MKNLIAIALSLLLTTSLFAQDINWKDFDHAFSTKADYQETPFGLYAVLQRSEEINGSNYANYFSGIGGFGENGEFNSFKYEIVSEKWTLLENGWHIDQWLFSINLKQELTYNLHRTFIKTFDSTVLEMENLPESDETYNQKANEILSDWAKVLK